MRRVVGQRRFDGQERACYLVLRVLNELSSDPAGPLQIGFHFQAVDEHLAILLAQGEESHRSSWRPRRSHRRASSESADTSSRIGVSFQIVAGSQKQPQNPRTSLVSGKPLALIKSRIPPPTR